MNSLKLLLCLGLALCSTATWALSTDREQPITIEADQGQIDDLKGEAIYQGNVIITQGTIRIVADKVTLHYTDQQDINKVTAQGAPATFRQKPDKSEEFLQASAKQMEYFADQDMLQLTQEARVWQGKDVVTGEKITYDTRGGIIRAFKGRGGQDRVTVTLQPRRDK